MTQRLAIKVHGLPAPQGSKRHVGNGVMVESSKRVKPWRQDVVTAALAAINAAEHFEQFNGPVKVHATFSFTRPKYHFGTGRNANVLKSSAPTHVGTKPDIEKLVRSTHDALTTAGVWRDDALVVQLITSKVYDTTPGAYLMISEILL